MMCTDGGTIEAVHTAHSHCLSLRQATMTQAKSTMKTTAGAPYRLQHSLVVSTTLNEVIIDHVGYWVLQLMALNMFLISSFWALLLRFSVQMHFNYIYCPSVASTCF